MNFDYWKYIGVLAIELVLGLIGTALWVVEGVVMNDSTYDALGLPDSSDKTPVRIAITLAATIPVVVLLNVCHPHVHALFCCFHTC